MKFQRGDLAEAPPPDLAAKGLNPKYTVLRLPTAAERDAYCRAHGVEAHDQWIKRLIEACVAEDTHVVVLPTEGSMDPVRLAADTVHEYAHTWAGPHGPDGRGWPGWPPPNVSMARQTTGPPADPRDTATVSMTRPSQLQSAGLMTGGQR